MVRKFMTVRLSSLSYLEGLKSFASTLIHTLCLFSKGTCCFTALPNMSEWLFRNFQVKFSAKLFDLQKIVWSLWDVATFSVMALCKGGRDLALEIITSHKWMRMFMENFERQMRSVNVLMFVFKFKKFLSHEIGPYSAERNQPTLSLDWENSVKVKHN